MAKKFAFSLQRLLSYKEQLFDIERTILTDMNAELAKMNAELAVLYREHGKKGRELNEKLAVGVTPYEMAAHKNYLTMLEDAIAEKHRQIAMQQAAIDRQMDKVREAKMEISTIEKLREKKLEEYVYKDGKEQEQFIEEFVSHGRSVGYSI